MRRAALAALLGLAAGCASPPPPAVVPVEERPVRSRPIDQAISDGVSWLIANQRPGGYWGTGCVTWGYDIYGSVPSAQFAFKAGTTGLCAMALREEGSPRAMEAARKAERWLVEESVKLRRGDQDELYNVWGDIYALQALALAARQETDPAWKEQLRAAAAEHVDLLRRYESAWGGWMYYDFATRSQTPGYPPTSFTTAAGLVAFREAQDAGIAVPEHLVKSCLRIVEKCRLGNNAYLYAWGHRYRPLHPVNLPQGSLGRTQCCNEGLLAWGSPKVTVDDARRGLSDLFKLQGFLECGRKRPIPHEAYYAVSGYFYYYGHYYAARLIGRLPEAERAPVAAKLSEVIRGHQEEDGCWWDYNAIWDFHKPYGTAYALMILLRCREATGAGAR
ncbi:MAG: hypothetical protein IT452_09115 [Planctomycetia bacterium]|nr:hypothetical protein [Planctomycetia bacterium]